MKRLAATLALLLFISSSANADSQDLAWAIEGHKRFGIQADLHLRAYIDGFRNGYLSMYVSQSRMDGGNLPDNNPAVEAFIDCIYLHDTSKAIHERLIAAAEDSPKELVMTWLREDFEKQCGDELTAALSVLSGWKK